MIADKHCVYMPDCSLLTMLFLVLPMEHTQGYGGPVFDPALRAEVEACIHMYAYTYIHYY